MKKFIWVFSVILTMVLTLALDGCGGDKIANGNDQNKDGSSIQVGSKQEQPTIAGEDVFQSERYPEMIWGYYKEQTYHYTGSNEDTVEFRKDMKYEVIPCLHETKELSVLPLSIQAGSYAHFMSAFYYEDDYHYAYTEKGRVMFRKYYAEQLGNLTEEQFQKMERILDLNVVSVYFISETGGEWSALFAYEIRENRLAFYEVSVDDDLNIDRGEEPVVEYEFLHDGAKLTLACDEVQRSYFPYGYHEEDRGLDFSGYSMNAKTRYQDLEGLSVRFDSDGEIWVYAYLSNDRKPIDPVFELDKKTGSFTLSWKQYWDSNADKIDDPGQISGKIVPCVGYGSMPDMGFFLIMDGECYPYLSSYDDYFDRYYSSFEDAEDLSGSDLEDLNAAKKGILEALEKAFKEAGIQANIDKESGKVELEASFLFDTDSYALSDSGKEYLDAFVEVYSSVVLGGEYSGFVSRIIVEGHTDTSGSYSYNQTLSQNRAEAVTECCIGKNAAMEALMEAVGYSYDYPVYNSDGTVNMEASRRVSFRFMLAAN